MDAYSILAGKAGDSIKALALSAINFELGRLLVGHPGLKMPEIKADRSPDQFRDLVRMPEQEQAEPDLVGIDTLANGIIATCAMAFDLARKSDFNERGALVRPHAWLIDRVRTPLETINRSFDWRSEQAGKLAEEQALLLGLKDKAAGIAAAATARSNHDTESRREYALAEIEAAMNPNIMSWEEVSIIDLLESIEQIDIVRLTKAAAIASVDRTKSRLMAGQFARIDEEVVLFANQ